MKRLSKDLPGHGWQAHNRSMIEEVAVGDLLINPSDPWKNKPEDVERAIPFVKRYGAEHVMPVMVDSENNVLIGTAFVEAAGKAGVKHFRVMRQAFAKATERKLFSVAGTKISSTGFWDGDALAQVVLEFERSIEDFSHDLIAFPPGLLDKLIGATISAAGADDLPVAKSFQAVSSVGRLWLAGAHRIMCGDATYFGSKKEAEVALRHYVELPGYVRYPNGFFVEEVQLGRLHWEESLRRCSTTKRSNSFTVRMNVCFPPESEVNCHMFACRRREREHRRRLGGDYHDSHSSLSPTFPVDDLAEARSFYGGLLGCAEGHSSSEWIDFNF